MHSLPATRQPSSRHHPPAVLKAALDGLGTLPVGLDRPPAKARHAADAALNPALLVAPTEEFGAFSSCWIQTISTLVPPQHMCWLPGRGCAVLKGQPARTPRECRPWQRRRSCRRPVGLPGPQAQLESAPPRSAGSGGLCNTPAAPPQLAQSSMTPQPPASRPHAHSPVPWATCYCLQLTTGSERATSSLLGWTGRAMSLLLNVTCREAGCSSRLAVMVTGGAGSCGWSPMGLLQLANLQLGGWAIACVSC